MKKNRAVILDIKDLKKITESLGGIKSQIKMTCFTPETVMFLPGQLSWCQQKVVLRVGSFKDSTREECCLVQLSLRPSEDSPQGVHVYPLYYRLVMKWGRAVHPFLSQDGGPFHSRS